MMNVEVLYFAGCPNHPPAVERLRTVIEQEGVNAEIIEREVTEPATAGFLGSPTIRVNGKDIDPAQRGAASIGLACRCYRGGLPSVDMIRAALREVY
ncbi:MAG: hypothetical protein JWO80_1341 [Bryobacterales bacterium]|nr:hypothetical protein [Bryobacterales bacterium]